MWTGERGFGNRKAGSKELVFNKAAEGCAEKGMKWLLLYARKIWASIAPAGLVPVSTITTEACPARKTKTKDKKWKCHLCTANPYVERSGLTRHLKGKHIEMGLSCGNVDNPRWVIIVKFR